MNIEYPNLAELVNYHPYHIRTFAEFADVTVELLKEGIIGTEKLSSIEILNIAKYAGVDFGILTCPRLIFLYKSRWRHCKMMEKLEKILYEIREAQKGGSHEADIYMQYGRIKAVNMLLDFQNNSHVTYCRYLGVLEEAEQTLSFIKYEKHKPRDIKKKLA